MLVTPTTTPTTGPRVLSVTVTEAPLLTSTTGASVLSEGTGLESAVVSSVGTLTQAESGSARESSSATAVGGVSAPFISVSTEAPSVVRKSSVVTSETGLSTEDSTITSRFTSSVLGEVIKITLSFNTTAQSQKNITETGVAADKISATINKNVSVFEFGAADIKIALINSIGTPAVFDTSVALETLSSTLSESIFTSERGRGIEHTTFRANITPAILKEILSVTVASSLIAAEGGTVKEKGITTDLASVLGTANGLLGESGLVQTQPTLNSKLNASSILVATLADENVLASSVGRGLLKEVTQAFEEMSSTGVGKLNINPPLLRISLKIRLVATEAGNVLEQSSTGETSVLSGISFASTKESGTAFGQTLLTSKFSTYNNEVGIGQERGNIRKNTSLNAEELALLNSVLVSEAESKGNVKELGTTFEFTTLNKNSKTKVTDKGRTVSSAFLKAKSDAFSVEASLASEPLSLSSNLLSDFTETGQATESASVFGDKLLNASEVARATEEGQLLAESNAFIIEIGDAVASLLPVRLNEEANTSFTEIGTTGEAAVLKGVGTLNAITRGQIFAASSLKITTGLRVTESGVIDPQLTVTAAANTTGILPTLLANEGAVLNAFAQTSFSESVPQRIAEIQAVLKNTMGVDATMTDVIIIDTIIQD